jgi:hypothetical protein
MLDSATNTRVDPAAHDRVVVPVTLRALEAQRLVSLIAFKVNPAVAAGLIAYAHVGEVGSAILVAAAMLAALQLVERSTLPLGLMPAARLGVRLLAPVLGAAAAAGLAQAAGGELAYGDLQAPVAGAWLVMALGAWVTMRFDDDRRVRVAVIGSAGFASDLAEELDAAGIRAYEVIGWFGREAPLPDTPAVLSGRLDYLGSLGDVRFAILERRIELLVCGRAEPVDEDAGTDSNRDPYALIADSCLGPAWARAARNHGLGLVPLHHASPLSADLTAMEAVL